MDEPWLKPREQIQIVHRVGGREGHDQMNRKRESEREMGEEKRRQIRNRLNAIHLKFYNRKQNENSIEC